VLAQREAARRELERARIRLEVIDQMLTTLPLSASSVEVNGATMPRPLSASLAKTLSFLGEAGPEGVSARELAARDNLPLGTASSRLSMLKSAGHLGLDGGKYFALHSAPHNNSRAGEH
jgi:hypothetical protein